MNNEGRGRRDGALAMTRRAIARRRPSRAVTVSLAGWPFLPKWCVAPARWWRRNARWNVRALRWLGHGNGASSRAGRRVHSQVCTYYDISGEIEPLLLRPTTRLHVLTAAIVG